jgi:hypothetical protein
VIASTGRAVAIVASTGNNRAASLPSTTSALERSLARTSSKVPCALSWQITPAVAAGAASRTVTLATHSMIPKYICARSACACMVEGPRRCDSTSQTSASPPRSTPTKPARQAYIVQRRLARSHS